MQYDYRHGMQILRDSRVRDPAIVYLNGKFHVFALTCRLGSGSTIEEALHQAGFIPPVVAPSVLFIAVGLNIVRGEVGIASARSNTMALRIANALNAYIPGDRGY